MPVLHIHSNVPQDSLSFREFTAKAAELLAEKLDKNVSYVQILYSRSMILFGNQSGPSALVELTSVDLRREKIDELTEPLSKLIERTLGFPPPTTYLHFHSMPRENCVWNGRPLPPKG